MKRIDNYYITKIQKIQEPVDKNFCDYFYSYGKKIKVLLAATS